nr:sulfatase-like hydrolase/transferase [Bacteroidota bacterium]
MNKYLIAFCFFIFSCDTYAQRNVILIIADDIGTDYFGFYEDHNDTVDVPNIRSLMNNGIRFKNAMSNPVCSPTRAGIFTGRYSFRTGVGGIVGGGGGSNPLDTAEISIPKLLNVYNLNIVKAQIGKWHLNPAMPQSNLQIPLALGYNHFEGPFTGALTNYTNWTKYTNGVASTITTYATTENVNNAMSWINNQTGKPFFLWLAFNAPHSPYHLPPNNLHSYVLSGTPQDIMANPKNYFKASLQALDTEIGRMIDSLKAINRFDSTDFIFVGDNGNTSQTAQIANINRAKGTIYQYGVYVPFIISGPSVVNKGTASDALINTVDIFATVNELMGNTNWQAQIPANKPVDSKSIVPILKNQSSTIRPWSFTEIFKLTPDADDGKAIRNNDYKLLRFDDGHEEFYCLANDSLELNDLLPGTLNGIEISNYNYLCSEIATLLGIGTLCNYTSFHQLEYNNDDLSAYPNPFTSFIYIQNKIEKNYYQLIDYTGKIIYDGDNITSQNFSHLQQGIYLLQTTDVITHRTSTQKLVKQ